MRCTTLILGFAALLTSVTSTFVVPINSASTAFTLPNGSSRFFYQNVTDLSIHQVGTQTSPANGILYDVVLVPGNQVRENTPLACLIFPSSSSTFGIVFLLYINNNNQLSEWTYTDAKGWFSGTLDYQNIAVAPGTNFLYAIASSPTNSETARIGYLNPSGNLCEVLATGGVYTTQCY